LQAAKRRKERKRRARRRRARKRRREINFLVLKPSVT